MWLERVLAEVTVRGKSMEPACHEGERVLVRRAGRPRPGQVVVVEAWGLGGEWHDPPLQSRDGPVALSRRHWLIKRVAAIPGDPVPRNAVPALADALEDRVPSGRLVLLGDNHEASFDSRQLGYFPADRVLGTVLHRLP